MTMDNINLEGQEPPTDEHAVSCSLVNSTEFGEDNHSNVNFSEINLDFEKIISKLPLILDIKQPKFSRRCKQIQRTFPCSNEFNFHNYIINANENFAPYCVDSDEVSSGSHGISCGNEPLVDIPANVTASDYVFKRSNHRKTTRSINNLSDFFVECSPDGQSGNIIISPSARWIYDSIEGTMKRTGLKEISLSLDPRICSQLPENPQSLPKFLTKQRSEAKFSQELILSCSSTRSISSYLSASSTHGCVNSALLYCVWESDGPYFLFIVDNGGDEVYVASPQDSRPSVDKSLDYIYLFHSWNNSRKGSKKNVINASHVAGEMTVSCSLIVRSNRSKFMETEFVLFGANGAHSTQKEKTLSKFEKRNWQSRKLAKIFRPSHSSEHNPKRKVSESWQFFPDELQTNNEPDGADRLVNDFPPNLELAAIVVRDYGYKSSGGAAFGGWGLKFLDKVEHDDADFSGELQSSSSGSSEERSRGDRNKTARYVTVLVPAGFHGGPVTRAGGPSSLTERWRSGGHCDCGGWDAGCPLKVLNNDSICSNVLPRVESEEDRESFELYIEGGDHREPTLTVLNVSKDTYVVNFQSSLSGLQSFSIGVAFIHSQISHLYPKL